MPRLRSWLAAWASCSLLAACAGHPLKETPACGIDASDPSPENWQLDCQRQDPSEPGFQVPIRKATDATCFMPEDLEALFNYCRAIRRPK